MATTSASRRPLLELLGVVLVLLTMIAAFLPGITSAQAGTVPPFGYVVTDGVPNDQASVFTDDCNTSHDDSINGGEKLNTIHLSSTPIGEGNVTTHSDLCKVWLDTATDADDDVWLYFAWERHALSLTSVVLAIEMQQAEPSSSCDEADEVPTCNPFAPRQAGDVLLGFDFTGNSARIYKRTFGATAYGPITTVATANVHPATPNIQRGEGAVNLTDAGILPSGNTTCRAFRGLLPFSMTGNSDQAQLMDYVAGTSGFPTISNCGLLIVDKVTVPSGLTGPFTATLQGGPKTISASGPLSGHGATWTFGDDASELLFAGTYTVGETGIPAGWSSDYGVSCTTQDGASTGTGGVGVSVSANETTRCTITNTAVLPTITVLKVVTDRWGGGASQADFTPRIDGSATTWGAATEVSPGSHTVSETGALLTSGAYVQQSLACVTSGTTNAVAHPLDLGLGDDVTCTITNVDQPATITLVKTVENDHGGTATAASFTPAVDGGATTWNTPVQVAAGSHTASESSALLDSGAYVAGTWGGDCAADGTLTAVNGGSYTCTITNDDQPATLTVNKIVDNGHGGTATLDDFTPAVDGGAIVWGTPVEIAAGSHTVSESSALLDSGAYAAGTWGGDCAADGSLTAVNGGSYTCTITNADVPATVTLVKTVENDHGGTATAADFTPAVDGTSTTWGTPTGIDAGPHTVSESGALLDSGAYVAGTWGGDCAADGSLTAVNGGSYTCTITNADVPATVTLVKTVENDHGGTATAADFTPAVDGGATTWGTPVEIAAGSHTVSESGALLDSGAYAAGTWGGDCAADGTLTAVNGASYTCTITNRDVPANVTLVKTVRNDHGGTATAGDFTPTLRLGEASAVMVWGIARDVSAGTYTAVESSALLDSGAYVAGTWGGDCAADGTLTAVNGGSYTCTITNTDVAPTLTIVKRVVNDDGGTAEADDFTPAIDGDATSWGTPIELSAGVAYLLTESGPDGYAASTWGGDCNVFGVITLELGQDATCTITNDDIAPTLTVVKIVTNDDGGEAEVADFALAVNGDPVTSGEPTTRLAGATYTITESGPSGYAQTGLACEDDGGAVAHPVVLGLAQDVVCTITNDDLAPGLTVFKSIVNDDGGDLTIEDVELLVDGAAVVHGEPVDVVANRTYVVSETPVDGYTLTGIVCTNGTSSDGPAIEVRLAEGEAVGCTLTNDDIAPTVTVIKEVVGGSAGTDAFGLTLDGQPVTSGATTAVTANAPHVVSETGATGYEQTGLLCTDDATEQVVAHPLWLDEGQDVTCVLTNASFELLLDKEARVTPNGGGLKVVTYEPRDADDEVVVYDFTVTNSGSVTLTDLVLVDDVLGPVTLAATTLAPGASTTGTATHVLTQADSDRGFVANIGTVTGLTPGERVVEATDTERVFLVEVLPSNPAIELVKTAQVELDDDGLKTVVYEAGDPDGAMITYTYEITNTGDVELRDITLVDDILGDIVLPRTTLAPGESMTATATHLVTGADAKTGEIVNVAEATGFADGGAVKAQDDETVHVIQVLAELPVTGVDAATIALLALIATSLGGALLLLGGRRRTDQG